jgi:hypothetical protein
VGERESGIKNLAKTGNVPRFATSVLITDLSLIEEYLASKKISYEGKKKHQYPF